MRILSVGAGKRQDSQRIGTDFIDLYPSRPEVIKCDVDKEKFPYQDWTFDRVEAIGLLEHLTNPSNLFKESYRVLKKGGILKIVTNNAGLWGAFGSAHYGGYVGHGEHNSHYALFTTHHLKNWFKKFGFTDIKIKYKIGRGTKLRYKIPMYILSSISKRFYPSIIITGVKK